eukprot:3742911-Rhodomonas_salina.1
MVAEELNGSVVCPRQATGGQLVRVERCVPVPTNNDGRTLSPCSSMDTRERCVNCPARGSAGRR